MATQNNEQTFQFTEEQKVFVDELKKFIYRWHEETAEEADYQTINRIFYYDESNHYIKNLPQQLVILYRMMRIVLCGKLDKGFLTIELIGILAGLGHSKKVVGDCQQWHRKLLKHDQNYRNDFSVIGKQFIPYIKRDKDLYSVQNFEILFDCNDSDLDAIRSLIVQM